MKPVEERSAGPRCLGQYLGRAGPSSFPQRWRRALGFHVVAVQSPLSSIAEDVAATRRMIDAQDGPVLLVGHSYGGAVITEAGNNDKVVGLVYVAAPSRPTKGETLGGMAKKYPTAPLFGELQPIEDGFLLLTAKGVKEDFAQDLPDEEQRLLLATQAATQAALLSTPIKAAAWHKKPSWFVVAANDRAISPEQEKMTAKRMNAKNC